MPPQSIRCNCVSFGAEAVYQLMASLENFANKWLPILCSGAVDSTSLGAIFTFHRKHANATASILLLLVSSSKFMSQNMQAAVANAIIHLWNVGNEFGEQMEAFHISTGYLDSASLRHWQQCNNCQDHYHHHYNDCYDFELLRNNDDGLIEFNCWGQAAMCIQIQVGEIQSRKHCVETRSMTISAGLK